MNNNTLNSEIKISFDNDFVNRLYNVTPSQVKLLKEMTLRIQKNVDKVLVRKLEKLAKENPNLPQLVNFLTVAFMKMKLYDKALATNMKLIEQFPDYLHARLNAANHFISINQPDQALEYLGEHLDLKSFAPERSEFHFSEVQDYYYSTVLFAIAKRDLPLAENRLAFYRDIDQENPQIAALVGKVENLKYDLGFYEDNYLDEIVGIEPPVTDRVLPLDFNHPQIHKLYQIGFKDSISVLEEILTLPRETLIEDLELVLQDAIERYPHFSAEDWSVYSHSFPVHALFLLMELKATESLKSVLAFLQYEENFLELYIGDFLTEDIWQVLYFLGNEQVSLLKSFLQQPGVYTFTKSAVSQVLLQITIHEPHRNEEIEQVFSEMLTFFINAKAEDNVIDTVFIGLMISDISSAKMTSLYPLIKELYDLGYVDFSIEGDYDNFLTNSNKQNEIFSEYKVKTLSAIYSSTDFPEESEEFYIDDDANMSFFEEDEKVIQLTPEKKVKVNRNDPCPCGSGIKFKKCCGK